MHEAYLHTDAGFCSKSPTRDVQLYQEPSPGGRRPQQSALSAHGNNGFQQCPGGVAAESLPVLINQNTEFIGILFLVQIYHTCRLMICTSSIARKTIYI